jgi:hypothetical protein
MGASKERIMKMLSMRNLLSSCAVAACLVICIPSFGQSQLAGAVEISHNNTVMLLPVPARVTESGTAAEKGLTFYIPLTGQAYSALKFEPVQGKDHITLHIYGVDSKAAEDKTQPISSARSTLLENYDFSPNNKQAVTAKKASALAGETITVRFMDKQEAAKRLSSHAQASEQKIGTNSPCQASYVTASFSPKSRLNGMMMFSVPVGCAKCGGTTVCPNQGQCLQTACGTVCN